MILVNLPNNEQYRLYISHESDELGRFTTCEILLNNETLGQGMACCHHKDHFCRRKGVSVAVSKALKEANLPKDIRSAIWNKVWNGKYTRKHS